VSLEAKAAGVASAEADHVTLTSFSIDALQQVHVSVKGPCGENQATVTSQ
jgi:hypothetical protein